MERLRGRVAAITGAGSGIGRALAQALASEGCALALSDKDEATVQATAEAISGVEVSTAVVDVAERQALEDWAEQANADHGAVHILINNAGVAMASRLRFVSHEDFEWLMGINFWGVIYGTRAFLPILEKQDQGHIVNLSSIFGIISVPMNGSYNASKFAVRGYSEALRMELQLDGLPIGVTCIHPGGVKTNVARAARHNPEDLSRDYDEIVADFERMSRTTPEQCAALIIDGIKKNRPRVLVGQDARLLDTIQRLAPTAYQALVKRVAGRVWKKR